MIATAVVGLLTFVAACSDVQSEVAVAAPMRAGRFGSLRDLVLFERPERGAGGALFFDRFEVTRGDWAGFAATAVGRDAGAHRIPVTGEPALPASLMSLQQARAFARWRFLRLPRAAEWRFAAVGDGRSRFPWGGREDATRANTAELGLGEPMPVGTFESGRRAGGDQPYDLIGNVSEWTETVPPSWCVDLLDPRGGMPACCRKVMHVPALAVWQGAGGLVPLVWAVQAGGDNVPREVVGGDFQSSMGWGAIGVEPVPAGDRRLRTGLRLCTTANELLLALADEATAPSDADAEQLRRFVHRGRHRDVLREAWSKLVAAGHLAERAGSEERPLARLLQRELGAPPPANGR